MCKNLVFLALLPMLSTACSSSNGDREGQSEGRASIEDSVIGAPLNDALERARGVEATVQAEADELRRKIEEAEGR